MKHLLCGAAAVVFAFTAASPASAQFGGLLRAAMGAGGGAPAKTAEQLAAEAATAAAAAMEQYKQNSAVQRQLAQQVSPEIEAFAAKYPEKLRPMYVSLYNQGENAAVLNFQRIGLAAMELGHYDHAERALDAALDRIETIYAKDPQAEKARSLFRKESNKDFRGEPYERAMAYYYRGLLYLRAGDYENARASFMTAEFQDTVSEEESYQSDFAVMNYLSGWASHCLGDADRAAEAFAAAAKAEPSLTAPAADANLLLISELGLAPIKTRTGAQRQLLSFEPVPEIEEDGALFTLEGLAANPLELKPVRASSVFHQATTRGGRPVQGILNGKAQFKGITEGAGDLAMNVSQELMNQGHGNAGMWGMVAGLGLKALSSAARADADIRMWDNLPDQIMVATAHAAKPSYSFRPKYLKKDAPLELAGTPVMNAQAGKCGIAWTRARSAAAIDVVAPGFDAGVMKARGKSKKGDAANKDALFRQALLEQ